FPEPKKPVMMVAGILEEAFDTAAMYVPHEEYGPEGRNFLHLPRARYTTGNTLPRRFVPPGLDGSIRSSGRYPGSHRSLSGLGVAAFPGDFPVAHSMRR